MEKQLPQEGVKLLNSYFSTTILPKDEKMINRYVKKKAIDRSLALIMPVNEKNHWYFAKFDPLTLTLTVFDSLKKRIEYYLEN
jgi:Ulp1 family protease